jgi:hypothetical protein
MKRAGRIAAWTGLALLVLVGHAACRTVWGKPFTLGTLANRQALEYLIRSPETFTAIGIMDGTIFDRSRLDRQDQITYDILVDQYHEWIARVKAAPATS